MKLSPIASFALLLFASPVFSQPKTGDVQPDRIAVGRVHVGTAVEASFLVYEAGINAGIKLDAVAPKFVKVLKKKTEARQFGPGKNFVTGTVEISIDTSTLEGLRLCAPMIAPASVHTVTSCTAVNRSGRQCVRHTVKVCSKIERCKDFP